MTPGTANRIDGFDGRIVAAETFDGAGAMLQVALPAASEKDMTLSAYARAWLAGMEGSGSAGLNAPLRPYQQSLWVYRCVSEIFKACAGIPLRLSRESAGLKYSSKGFRAEIRRTKVRTLRPAKGRQAVCLGRAAGES